MAQPSSLPRLLIVEDEEQLAQLLAEFLTQEGFEVTVATEGRKALELITQQVFHLVLSDIEVPGIKGVELLRFLRGLDRPPEVVLMSGFGTMETAIAALRDGAFDYIPKPFRLDDLSLTLKKAYEHKILTDENIQLKESLTLYQLSFNLNQARSLDELAMTLKKFLLETFPCDLYFFLLRGGEDWLLQDQYTTRQGIGDPVEILRSFSPGELIKRLVRMESIFFTGREEPSLPQRVPVELPPFGMIVPATFQGKILGVLGIFRSPPRPPFTPGERKTLEIIGSRLALSLENLNLVAHLEQTFIASIEGLINALEARDGYTRGHSERVARWAMLIGSLLHIPPHDLELLRRGALLHDIGKIGVKTDSLLRPATLEPEEYEEFKHHTIIGKRILEPIPFLKPVLPMVYLHHEHWDGSGYPLGLKGEEIPLLVRILSLADALEVMTTDRVYRKALTLAQTKEEIARCSGTQFDPELVALVLEFLAPYETLAEVPLPPLPQPLSQRSLSFSPDRIGFSEVFS